MAFLFSKIPRITNDSKFDLEISANADASLKDIHLTNTDGKFTSWELWASKAEFFNEMESANLGDVKLLFPMKNGNSITLTSKRGIINKEGKRVELSGDVVGMSSKSETNDSPPEETNTSKGDEGPIEIRSDKLIGLGDERIATFIGNVQAKSENYLIYSDKLIVKYDKDKKEIESITAEGNVKVVDRVDPTNYATGENADYLRAESKVILTGNPRLLSGNSSVVGDKIIIFLDTKKSIVEGKKDNQIRTIIYPKEVRGRRDESVKRRKGIEH